MNSIFVDTGGFVALLVAEDRMHARDALSFIVMERIGINEAIAFDRHFREYGRFTILR
jgi:predicted nucleic acid-binding protein